MTCSIAPHRNYDRPASAFPNNVTTLSDVSSSLPPMNIDYHLYLFTFTLTLIHFNSFIYKDIYHSHSNSPSPNRYTR